MPFTPSNRNMDNIEYADIRATLDGVFNTAHDELSDAYYNYWRLGVSHPWKGFDVQATPALSKALFDKLHDLIFTIREVRFHDANMALPPPQRYSEDRYRYVRDRQTGTILEDKLTTANAKIAARLGEGISLTIG